MLVLKLILKVAGITSGNVSDEVILSLYVYISVVLFTSIILALNLFAVACIPVDQSWFNGKTTSTSAIDAIVPVQIKV